MTKGVRQRATPPGEGGMGAGGTGVPGNGRSLLAFVLDKLPQQTAGTKYPQDMTLVNTIGWH